MRRTLVIALGTAASGAALHFRRLREAELRQLQRRLARAATDEQSIMEQRIRDLVSSIRLLAIDLDGTDAYRLPPPLSPDGSTWSPGEKLKLALNARDILDRFQAGSLPYLDRVNPKTIRGLDAENASGGARPNADLAFQLSADRVKSALRDALVELLKARGGFSSTQNQGIRVFLVCGTFGGTGSGGYDHVRLCLLRLADELGVHLDIYPVLLLPGAHAPKDPGISYANTFAVLKELAADATGCFWRIDTESTVKQRAGFRAPFIVSDINNAPGTPQIISESAFIALAGEIIYCLSTTAIGAHVDAQIGDFGVAGTTPTLVGEPRQARTIGFSTIRLETDRQVMWSTAVLAAGFVEKASTAAPESVIRRDVRAFLEGHALVLDHGRNDLSARLLEQCAAHEHLSLTRMRSLFGLATQELGNFQILGEGRNRLNLALQQCGDFGPALQRHAFAMAQHATGLVAAEVRRLLTDHNRGPASTSLWLAVIDGVIDAMLAAAGEDLAQLEAEIGEVDARIRQTEVECAERLRGRGFFYRTLHEGEVSRLAAAYRVDLESCAILRIRSQAASAGIQLLSELRRLVQRELRDTAEPIVAALPVFLERFREDQRQAASHSVEFACPNGLPLLVTGSDLAELHARVFRKRMNPKSSQSSSPF